MISRYTVLCVDDEALGLQIRRALLEVAGYQVLTAQDGPSGLVLFEDNLVHAVLLDYLMPGMDGGRVATAMRTIKPQVPILLHSACVDLPKEIVDMVDATIPKGEGPEMLISRLQLLIDASHSPMGAVIGEVSGFSGSIETSCFDTASYACCTSRLVALADNRHPARTALAGPQRSGQRSHCRSGTPDH